MIEVASINDDNIAPPPNIDRDKDHSNQFIEGIGKVDNKIWLLIDCNKLLVASETEEVDV